MSQVDVLIITALKEEYEAAREAGLRGFADNRGIEAWEDRDQQTPTPYIIGNYFVAGGACMSVALARPTRMGITATSPVVSSLVERLKPRCLAMCGVCAGNPADVALGDVIVAELAYAYDEGKRTQQAFEGDHRQIPLSDVWVRSAQDMSPVDLPSYGEASEDEAKIWLLERLNAGEDPRTHPARSRYFPRNTWSQYLLSLEEDSFLARYGAELSLTEKGRLFVQRTLYDNVQGPEHLPFKIVVGPIASGNVVVKDGRTWEQLKQWGVRTVVGLEMEAAIIASTAHRLNVANWLVAKGVMDYADPRKDDRHKRFAARASAEVLFKLLALHVISTKSPRARSRAQNKVTVDIAIITTLPEEHAAVHNYLERTSLVPGTRGRPNLHAWEFGYIKSDQYQASYRVALGIAGRAGAGSGLRAVMNAIRTFTTDYILLVGIAGGLGGLRKGDVVVSDRIYSYEYGKIDGSFHPRLDLTFPTDIGLANAARALSALKPNWGDDIALKPPEGKAHPMVQIGPIASGNKAADDISDPSFNALLRHLPKLKAVEMEGLDVAQAIQWARDKALALNFSMVRGISDLPRNERSRTMPVASENVSTQTHERDQWKRYASEAAAVLTTQIIRQAWRQPPRDV